MTLKVNPFTIWWVGKDDPSAVKFLTIDAVLEENHQGTSTVSKYPVQRGFQVSDHVIRHNRILDVRGVVTNLSFSGTLYTEEELGTYARSGDDTKYIEESLEEVGSLLNPDSQVTSTTGVGSFKDIESPVAVTVGEEDIPRSRVLDTFAKLREIQEEGYICQVSTMLTTYDPAVLISYSIPQNTTHSSTMYVDLKFEELRILDEEGFVTQTTATGTPTKQDVNNVNEKISQITGSDVEGEPIP